MAILAECTCHRKQSAKNRKCKYCGADLIKLKKNGQIRYWISFRFNGKQRREFVGYSAEEAAAADGKRKAQKKEGRILDILPGAKITFQDLGKWYLAQAKVQDLAYHKTLQYNISAFNSEFGQHLVNKIKLLDLENYQSLRKKAGKSDSYIDQEVGAARRMLVKAWENDMVSGDTLKPFKRLKKMLKKGSNKRDRVLSTEEFNTLITNLPKHARDIIIAAFYTGMRRGEVLSLTWDRVDFNLRTIKLERDQTKDDEKRYIPISDSLLALLKNISRDIRDSHVFLYKGAPLKDIRASLKKACEKSGIPYGRNTENGITFHDLRHTFNTNMRKAGTHDTVTMDITGHSTREMFDRYNTIDEKEKMKAVNAMDEMVNHGPLESASVDQNVDQTQKNGLE